MSRTPVFRVRYTLDVGSGVPTLREMIKFAEILEGLGEGRFLNSALEGTLRDGISVSGLIRPVDDPRPDPILQRIREELANYNANTVGQDILIHRIEQIVGRVEWADPKKEQDDDD